MMETTLKEIARRIKGAKSVLIVSHMRPDGDAFGSALSLSSALDFLKIPNQVCVETEIPSNLTFVKGIEKTKKAPTAPYDLFVAVDCSNAQRLGALFEELSAAQRRKIDTVNIDHHVSNTRFAKFNYVRECAANCMNMAKLIEYLGAPFSGMTGEYLLLGLLTDSGNFSHDDVNEETLSLAARLVEEGADIHHYNYHLFKKQPKARAKLFALTMSKIRYYFEDRYAAITIPLETMSECGADNGMTEGFVDFPLGVDSVEVAASVMEVKRGQYKISLRSKEYADVNKIAGIFGGGGHVRAAGCMLFGEIEEVLDKLSYAVSQYLE